MKTTRRRLARWLLALSIVGGVVAVALDERWTPGMVRHLRSGGDGTFEVKPYLQLGDAPPSSESDRLERDLLLWQTADRDTAAWSVEVQVDAGGPWVAAEPPSLTRIALDGVSPFRLYRAVLSGLGPGEEFAYRVRRAGTVVFEARGRARKPAGRPHRVAVFGDGADGAWAQSAVAYQTYQARPDYVVVTGDVVYMRGRVAEYLDHFFPIYNSDLAGRSWGAPLLRSTPFVTAAGNHDLIERDLDKHPDGLAYFYYWVPPLNGPEAPAGSPGFPHLRGSPARKKAFLDAAGPSYPRAANYSFDYGDVHWTILDTNTYADWTDPALRAWLDADLASARHSAWRFVAFHHPAFSSSKAHAEDQRTRVLAPLFEAHKVALVFNGHVHNYQRTHPLRFVPDPPPAGAGGKVFGPNGQVKGRWTIDTSYDGSTRTRPDGVISLVTGAGGARLYNAEQSGDRASWQPYTARLVSNVHSLTVVDVTPDVLTVRQVSSNGDEIDRFVVSRADVSDRGSRSGPTIDDR
jgi:hypothetical protein